MRALRVLVVVAATAVAALLGGGVATAAPAAAPAPAVVPAVAPVASAVALAPGTPCAATARACVDLSARKAWLISGGRIAYGPVPALGGKKGARTPIGTFTVSWKDIDHLSREFDNAPMPYSVFFTSGGVAFHQGSLKTPSSGCVHLSRAAAKTFYGTLRVGDRVQVVS